MTTMGELANCPSCAEEVLTRDAFCENCGQSLRAEMLEKDGVSWKIQPHVAPEKGPDLQAADRLVRWVVVVALISVLTALIVIATVGPGRLDDVVPPEPSAAVAPDAHPVRSRGPTAVESWRLSTQGRRPESGSQSKRQPGSSQTRRFCSLPAATSFVSPWSRAWQIPSLTRAPSAYLWSSLTTWTHPSEEVRCSATTVCSSESSLPAPGATRLKSRRYACERTI